MNILLLSGGSGKRLWPLSNGVRSKQFIKCLKKEDGSYESMLQRVSGQITAALPDAKITVVTSKPQVSAVLNQLGEGTAVCAEPVHRDLFPAMSLAAYYLRDVQGAVKEKERGQTAVESDAVLDEIVAVCPADTFVSGAYFELLSRMEKCVRSGQADLAMTAVTPTYPSEKYGYVILEDDAFLKEYFEKPDEKTAASLIGRGALWSGGVFVTRLKFLTEMVQNRLPFEDYEELYADYEKIPELSFEKELIRSAEKTAVFPYEGEWKTLGTWNTLTEAMEDPNVGNALFDDCCKNVHVVNELDVPVLCMGLSDVVVSASPEGILVSDKIHSSYIGPYVDQIDQRIMFADKSWGSYRVLDAEDESMTIKVTLNPGHSMNYHSHERRDEVWTIISGKGKTIVDGMEQPVKAGDVITMEAGCRHTIIAETELHLIEVQLGREISVHDKKKYEFEF